jgi:hypothetical protein
MSMPMMNMNTEALVSMFSEESLQFNYKSDEVLGKRVEIEFEIDAAQSLYEFYPGTVHKVLSEFKEHIDGTYMSLTKHYVLFDDGEKKWFDLAVEAAAGRMRWLCIIDNKSIEGGGGGGGGGGGTKRKRASPIKTETSEKKKLKHSPADKKRAASGSASIKHEEEETDQEDKIQGQLKVSDSMGDDVYFYDAISSPAEEEQQREEEEEAQEQLIIDQLIVELDVMPASIDEIIRYMDHLEPGLHYFERQKDSRNACSKTRGKLRKYAHQHPDDPAVRHWVESNNWQPPDQKALNALVGLIKTLIK